jgi:hypothetical protein
MYGVFETDVIFDCGLGENGVGSRHKGQQEDERSDHGDSVEDLDNGAVCHLYIVQTKKGAIPGPYRPFLMTYWE